MPRKSLGNKKREQEAQKQLQKERAKEQQRLRLEKEFVDRQLARGLVVRTMVFKEEDTEEVIEAAIVYKIKEGHSDPFDSSNMMYVQDGDGTVVEKERVSTEKEMKKLVEQFKNLK